MGNDIQKVFDLLGKTLHYESEFWCGTKDKNNCYTISHIEIRDSRSATLMLAGSNPNTALLECGLTADELKELANTWKIERANQEIYVATF